ncbi:MAG: molybdate ABC transporter permease subunit [Crocinitomicaceae bacterium]|nr:molybdate ABC transporter permease subunit [Crocinitomicaceae bacterium]
MIDLSPIWLSLKLALLTSCLLLIIGLPIAYALSQWKSRLKVVVESFVSLPIILPPTVIGFYLLIMFSPENAFGKMLGDAGIQIPFTFTGILLASFIYSFPFMVQPIQKGIESVPDHYKNISYTLGKSKFETFMRIILPNIKRSVITGFVLTFAHTMGEFGVILMIGGNIPGETKVASLAIYSDIEALNYSAAHTYSIILLGISVVIIIALNMLNAKKRR